MTITTVHPATILEPGRPLTAAPGPAGAHVVLTGSSAHGGAATAHLYTCPFAPADPLGAPLFPQPADEGTVSASIEQGGATYRHGMLWRVAPTGGHERPRPEPQAGPRAKVRSIFGA